MATRARGFHVAGISGLFVTRNRARCLAWWHLGWFGFCFLSPDRDLAPLGKVPITGRLCFLCECVLVGGCGAGGNLLGTRELQYRLLSASPAGWL